MKWFTSTSVAFAFALGSAASMSPDDKHPCEARASWDLHVARLRAGHGGVTAGADAARRARRPASAGDRTLQADDLAAHADAAPYTIQHTTPKQHVPFAGGATTNGIMIDAGSQGTRLHIFEWNKRFLLDEEDLLGVAHGQKLSYPTSNSRWSDAYTPGLDVFSFYGRPEALEQAVGAYLGDLLDFAKTVLRKKEDEWHTYPIYLKATGGLRTLSQPERVRLMTCVRKLFHNKTFNPFAFEDERARVISGEEEAIYGWVGVNFAKGVLLDQSKGTGTPHDPELTWGMLEMGGASTQIANFENDGDLMANLFKLQLGGARHWNVYVHSYLYSGINGAWSRLNALLREEGTRTNPCLPLGSEVQFDSWMHMNEKSQYLPRSDPRSTPYSITMSNNATAYDFDHCSNHTYKLLRKETNEEWCEFQMDGNCGFAGMYQPPLPQTNDAANEFVATSNFVAVFEFLGLGERASVAAIGRAAERVCGLDWAELQAYNARLPAPIERDHVLAQYCFRSVFVYQLLRNGWEFGDDYELTAVDVINGQKMGWPLGCMLYEINTLPWDFHPELLYTGPNKWLVRLFGLCCAWVGSVIGFIVAMRRNKRFNKAVQQHVLFQKSGLGNYPTICRHLLIPECCSDQEAEDLSRDSNNKTEGEREPLVKFSSDKYGE